MSSDRARNVTTCWFSFSGPFSLKSKMISNFDPPISISGKRCILKVESFMCPQSVPTANTTTGVAVFLDGITFPYNTVNDTIVDPTNPQKSTFLSMYNKIGTLSLQNPSCLMNPEILCVVPNGPTLLTFNFAMFGFDTEPGQIILNISFRPIE